MSDKVAWWNMGKVAAARHGVDEARELAKTFKSTATGPREWFLAGVNGEPKPRVRPLTGKMRFS